MAKNWFKAGLNRLRPSFDYKHLVIAFLVASIVLWSLVITGSSPDSSASLLRNIYLFSASYVREPKNVGDTQWNTQVYETVRNVTDSASLEMRVGFFSTCIRLSSLNNPDQAATQWHCATSPGDSGIASSWLLLEVHDPLGLVGYGAHFRSGVVFYGLFVACMILDFLAIVGLATFPGWREVTSETGSIREVKYFPSRRLTKGIEILLAAASLLGFVSVLWIHSAAVAAVATLKYGFSGLVDAQVGMTSMLVAWLGLFCTIVALMAVAVLILSIRLLDWPVDEEEEEG